MRTKAAKHPALQPEMVVQTALEMLDAEGLEGVTLRRLAAKLGVQAPALYWHFKNKRDLLDDMAQAILSVPPLAELAPPHDPGAWVAYLQQMAHALRQALLSRREGARVVAGAGLGRARALAEMTEQAMQTLHAAGFDLLTANLAITIIEAYTFGFVIEEQAEPEHSSPETSSEQFEQLARQFPMIDLALKARETVSKADFFDWGVQVILKGLQMHLSASSSTQK